MGMGPRTPKAYAVTVRYKDGKSKARIVGMVHPNKQSAESAALAVRAQDKYKDSMKYEVSVRPIKV